MRSVTAQVGPPEEAGLGLGARKLGSELQKISAEANFPGAE